VSSATELPVPELVRRVANGDQSAFLQLYDRYASRVFGLAVHITRHGATAEEVTQETFLKLWTSAGTFRPEQGRFSSWLLTITRRTAIDRLRYESRRPTAQAGIDVEADWLTSLASTGSQGQEARWQSLRFALQALPPEQRSVIQLSYYFGLSHSEIADYLDIPLGTAKTRIRLGMEKLRDAWLEGDSDASEPA
jgi:RNA polymerase sigma-70 factor (ECF subfamily)